MSRACLTAYVCVNYEWRAESSITLSGELLGATTASPSPDILSFLPPSSPGISMKSLEVLRRTRWMKIMSCSAPRGSSTYER